MSRSMTVQWTVRAEVDRARRRDGGFCEAKVGGDVLVPITGETLILISLTLAPSDEKADQRMPLLNKWFTSATEWLSWLLHSERLRER